MQGIDTPAPILVMQDGTRLACKYEHSMGTNLVFAADEAGQQRILCATDSVLRATPPEGSSRAVHVLPDDAMCKQRRLCRFMALQIFVPDTWPCDHSHFSSWKRHCARHSPPTKNIADENPRHMQGK